MTMETMLGTEMSETSRSLPTFQKVLLCTDFRRGRRPLKTWRYGCAKEGICS